MVFAIIVIASGSNIQENVNVCRLKIMWAKNLTTFFQLMQMIAVGAYDVVSLHNIY
jgi:hypothetical protein